MIQSIGNIVLFIMGWALFVAGQAQNSIRSKTNGLPPGFAGLHQWLSFNVVNLAQRAFWSGLFYGFIVHATVARLESAGFPITSYMAAGMGGWFANGALYQIFGLLGKREEVSDFAPPPNTQIVLPPPTLTSNGPNPNLGAKQP